MCVGDIVGWWWCCASYVLVSLLLTPVCVCVVEPQSPSSPTYQNQMAPIPYEQQQTGTLPSAAVVSPPPGGATDGTQSLPRHPQHPLKSFSVPGPPPSQTSTPTTPSPPKHIGMLFSRASVPSRACLHENYRPEICKSYVNLYTKFSVIILLSISSY